MQPRLRLLDATSTRAFRSAPASAARRPRPSARWSRPMRCCRSRCSKLELLKFAMQGEAVASGSLHVDNISPSLFGGLVLTVGIDHPRVKQIPVPAGVRAVIVHPHMFLSTQAGARHSQAHRRAVGFRLADRQSRRLHLRLLHERSRHDPRLVRGRGHRAAAPGADSGLPGRAPRGDGGGRARLLDLRRRSDDVRLGASSRMRRRCATPCGASSRPQSIRIDEWIVDSRVGGCAGHRVVSDACQADVERDAVQEHARSCSSRSASAQALLQGLAPDGGLYVPDRLAAHRCAGPFGCARPHCRALRRELLAPFVAGDPLARGSPTITADAFNFPGAARAARETTAGSPCSSCSTARRRRSRTSARAFSPPASRACARPASRPLTILVATSGDTGGAVAAAFHGRPGHRSRPCCFRRAWSRRPRSGSSPAGAATSDRSRCTAHSTTASAWSSRRSSTRSCGEETRAVVGQQHQSRPPAAAGGVLRRERASRSGRRTASAASFIDSERQSRQCGRLHLGAQDRAADRRHRAGAQRQSHRAGFSRTRGDWQPRASIATLASAMDVGNPSNMERLRALFPRIGATCASAVSA